MAGVSATDEDALRHDIDLALTSYPVLRRSDWQGPAARGGLPVALVAPRCTTPALNLSSIAAPITTSSLGEASYWQQLSSMASPQIAADVQRWLVRFVKDMSFRDINLMAGGEP
jgi:hypothetical protein